MWILSALALIASVVIVHLAVRRALLFWCEEQSRAIAFAATLAFLATMPVFLGRFLTRLDLGLYATALLGLCLLHFLRRSETRAGPLETPYRFALAVTALMAFFAMITTWTSYQFDESVGHIPLANVLFRNVIPPQHPYFPDEPFRYHYGFDVLVALVKTAHVSTIRAIDVVTTACFFTLLLMSYEICGVLGGRLAGSLGLFLVPLSAGTFLFFTFSTNGFGWLALAHPPIPLAWYDDWTDMVPPVISNFFQHPQGLGMPIALAILLLIGRDEGRPYLSNRRFVFGALLLGACSLSQVVYFGILGLALGMIVLIRAMHQRDLKFLAIRMLSLLGALAFGVALGGFLTPTGTHAGSFIVWGTRFFDDDSFPLLILRHFVLFGFPLFLLPLSALRIRKNHPMLRLSLLFSAVIGFTIPNIATYELSWDIVKFYGAGELFANVLLVDLLADYLGRLQKPRAIILAATACVLLTFSGWIWLVRHSILDGHVAGIPRAEEEPRVKIGEAVLAFLGDRVAPGDHVMATDIELGLSGLLTPGVTPTHLGLMIDSERHSIYADARRRAALYLRRKDLDILGARFVVLNRNDLYILTAEGRARINDKTQFVDLGEVRSADGEVRRVLEVVR